MTDLATLKEAPAPLATSLARVSATDATPYTIFLDTLEIARDMDAKILIFHLRDSKCHLNKSLRRDIEPLSTDMSSYSAKLSRSLAIPGAI